jgi:hypothetical protein
VVVAAGAGGGRPAAALGRRPPTAAAAAAAAAAPSRRQRRVPPVLHRVVGAPGQVAGDEGPLVAEAGVLGQDGRVLRKERKRKRTKNRWVRGGGGGGGAGQGAWGWVGGGISCSLSLSPISPSVLTSSAVKGPRFRSGSKALNQLCQWQGKGETVRGVAVVGGRPRTPFSLLAARGAKRAPPILHALLLPPRPSHLPPLLSPCRQTHRSRHDLPVRPSLFRNWNKGNQEGNG